MAVKNKKKKKNKGKNLDKTIEQLLKIKIYSNLTCQTLEFIDTHDINRIVEETNVIRNEIDTLKINHDLENSYANNIVNNKEMIITILNDFQEFMYFIFRYTKYKNLMSIYSIETKVIKDVNATTLINATIERVKHKQDKFLEISADFLNFLTQMSLQGLFQKEIVITIKHISHYIMLLSTYMLKIKNGKILGLSLKGNTCNIKYSNVNVINEIEINKLTDFEGKIKFTDFNKNFSQFVDEYYMLPQNVLTLKASKNQKKISNIHSDFAHSEIKLVYLQERLNKSYPFVAIDDFMIEPENNKMAFNISLSENNLNNILHKRKYVISKNGAIVEFINKNKAVDFVEVLETNDKYYFKIRYFNYNKVLHSLNKENILNESYRNSEKINKEFFDCIVYAYKKNVNFILAKMDEYGLDEMINPIRQCFVESNYIFMDIEMLEGNKITKQQFNNNIEHQTKQGIMLLNCLYVLYCDIKNAEVNIYNRTTKNLENKSNVIRDAYRTAHIRKLPKGWIASEEAKNNAKEMGVILPEGYTFVNEHISSEKQDNKRIVKVVG